MEIVKKSVWALVAASMLVLAVLTSNLSKASAETTGTVVASGTTYTTVFNCGGDPDCTQNTVEGELTGSITFYAQGLVCHPDPECNFIAEANYDEPVVVILDGYGTFNGTESGHARPVSETIAAFSAKIDAVSTDGCWSLKMLSMGEIVIATDFSSNDYVAVLQPLSC